MSKNNDVPLVVTTAHRGVFFGFAKPTENKTIRLRDAQMCVYWSADVKGVLGLASKGPSRLPNRTAGPFHHIAGHHVDHGSQ